MTTLPTDSVDLAKVLTPEQRMTASRKKLVAYMARGDNDAPADEQQSSVYLAQGDAERPKDSMLLGLARTLHTWWRHHPAKLVLEIAEPALNQYAKNKPYQLIGIAAVAGVATVFIRPWRLVSITGLLVAVVKSSGMTNMALSMLLSRSKSQARPPAS